MMQKIAGRVGIIRAQKDGGENINDLNVCIISVS